MARADIVLTITGDERSCARTLESVLNQSMRDWRVIACVAPGVEGVRDALAPLGDKVAIVETRRASLAAMRNEGLTRVEAEFVCVIREGDLFTQGALSDLIAGAQAGPHGAACGSWCCFDADGNVDGPPVDLPDGTLGVHESEALLGIPSGACLVRRELLEGKRFGGNLERWSHTDLWFRMCEDGVRWQVVPSVVVCVPHDEMGAGIEASRPEELRSVIERSFRRASAKGWEGEDLDEEHEAQTVRGAMFELATRAALGGSQAEASRAAESFAAIAEEQCLTAELLAGSAALGLRTSAVFRARIDGTSESAWAKPLHEWWSRCITGKWVGRAELDSAVGLLADLLVDRAEVADGLLGAFGSPGRVWIAGTDRSARAVVDRALESGWRVLVVPEKSARAGRDLLAMPSRVMVASVNEGIGSSDPLVIGSANEAEFFERYGARPNVARWNGAWRAVSQRSRQRLKAVWP